MTATATYVPVTWDEKPYGQLPPPTRMTKATVEFSFKGQFEGKAFTEYLMFYQEYDVKDPHRATATFVGLTRYAGTLNGKPGSFITEDHGTFEGGVARSTSEILSGSGTEELGGIRGTATGTATQKTTEFHLDYSL